MKNKNLLNLSKSLPGKLLLTLALVIGWGNFAWAQKSVPYSYGFENNDLATEGWTASELYSLSGIKASGAYGIVVYEGSYSFRFYNNYLYPEQYLISPELETSDTGIDVSFYYTTNIASYNETFSIGYSTTTAESSSFTWYEETPTSDTSWHLYERSFPSSTKYIALKYDYINDNSRLKIFFDDIKIEISETYKRPKYLTSSTSSSSATLSWTNGNDETAWQIAYSTKEDFDPDTEGVKVDVTENPYTLSGLIENVTYYAYVRSKYVVDEETHYSEWSNENSFILYSEAIINNGSTTSNYIPIYGGGVASLTQSQFIIPSLELTSIVNKYITKLTFFTNTASKKPSTISWGDATFEVYLNMVSTEKYSSTDKTYESWGTKVFNEAKLSVSDYKMEIEFDTPFLYTGNNLMIGFKQIVAGTNSAVEWFAYSRTYGNNYGINTYGSSTSVAYIVPKVTFAFVSSTVSATIGTNGYTTFACPRPLDLTTANLPSGLKAYKAAVNGTTVNFTEINQAVPANTGMLLEGTAGQTYAIPVADSGTTPEGNAFEVNSTGGTFTAESGYTYYGLKKNSDPLVFATFAPASVAIPTNKAYLKVANTSARELTCTFDDVTGISTVNHDAKADGQYFNLAGQRVAQPVKGLYIVNGRKVVMK